MRTKLAMSCIGLSLKENESKDGRKFYQISIDQDGEAGTLPINEDVYILCKNTFKKYSPVTLTLEFNDQYKTMRVIGLKQGV